MPFDPNVLRILCPSCGGALTVQCGPQDPKVGRQPFTCLYCGQAHSFHFGARVLWVTKGHEPISAI